MKKKTTNKIKHQKNQTCVLCHQILMTTTLDSISILAGVYVCIKPECQNFGLLQIGSETINAYFKGLK